MDISSGPDPPQKDARSALLRAEALRQLRWQKQQWQQTLAQVPPGAPVLTSPADRAWFHGCLDMLRDAGEEVPQAFYRPGSIIPASRDEGREAVRISLKSLVADIARVLAYFSDEADDEPGASVPADRS